MKRHPSDAMMARIGSYAEALPDIFTRLGSFLFGSRTYRPARHYMRGPGPKWREKQLIDNLGEPGDKRVS